MYKITPLPPYHHVANVDKASMDIVSRPLRPNQNSERAKYYHKESLADSGKRTDTFVEDFFPTIMRTQKGKGPFPRSPLLGVMLEPRVDSPIKLAQKDDWDFVLRHLFVKQAQSLAQALPSLGFNGIILLKDIEKDPENGPPIYAGTPVSGSTIIRDLDTDEWTRIVDVFHHWPFKPANLLLDQDVSVEEKQEMD